MGVVLQCGFELQGAHSAITYVSEPIKWGDFMKIPTQLVFQSTVHQEQAPSIGKGVIENAVQAIKGVVSRFERP